MYRYIGGMLLCLSASVTTAQTCAFKLRLQVVETHAYNPVFPAIVYVEQLNRAYPTSDEGKITIDSLCEGTYTLQFAAAGYTSKTETIAIAGNKDYKLKVVPADHLLKEVQVTDERSRTVVQNKAQLGAKELAANSGKSLGDMLQAINGVTTLSNGATVVKPVIHGMHSNRIVMLNNGIRQEDQQWGGEHAPNIDPFLANNITVIKGAAGVRYGTDAIGGVVLVEAAPLRHEPGTNGEINLAGFSNNRMGVASGMVEHNFKKIPALTIRLQGTVKKGGNYRIPGYWAANTGLNETNYSATIGYRKLHYGAEAFYSHFNTNLGIYRGSHAGNQQDLMNAINSPYPLIPSGFTYALGRPRQHVQHDLVKLKLYADTKAGLWNLTYGFQHNFRQEYDVQRVETNLAQLNLTLNTQTLNLNLDHKPVKGISGQVGIDGVLQDNFFRNGDQLFIPAYSAAGIAGYIIERYKLAGGTLEGGLRYDYKHYSVDNPEGNGQQLVHYNFDYNNVSGTVGYKKQVTPQWQWSATLANAWRAPQASELFSAGLHQGAARIEIGNKNLNPEKSHSLNLETKYTYRQKLTADVSVYSQLIDDFIYLQPGGNLLTIRGYYKTFNYTQTNAWLNGSDITLHYAWNDYLETSLKGSILRARNRQANDWLILMPSDRLSFSARYTRNISHVFQECFVAADARYVLQQTRIPGNFDQIDYPRPPAAYFIADASAGTKVLLGKQPFYLSISVTNMLNTRYREYLDVFRYFIDAPGSNVIVRLRVPFK